MSYFTITELCRSERAAKLGVSNLPNKEQAENMANLINKLLDPLRKKWGKPIYVTSGFRSEKLNAVTPGASNTSQHTKGQAVDIVTNNKSIDLKQNMELFKMILCSKISFDQLIYERGDDTGPQWIHISYKNASSNRNQILRTKDGKSYFKYM